MLGPLFICGPYFEVALTDIGLVVQTYIEDMRDKGAVVARNRLRQKWELSCFDHQQFLDAVVEWEELSRHFILRERNSYKIVMGIGAAGIIANMLVVLLPQLDWQTKMLYCIIVSAAMVLCFRFAGYSKEAVRRLHGELAMAESLRRDVADLC